MFDDVINQWDKNVYPEMLFHSSAAAFALRPWRPDVRGLLIIISFLLAITRPEYS